MSFANRLKEIRLRKNLSLQKAADLVEISKTHFWELESGKSRNPSVDLLERISNHFGVSMSWLLGEGENSGDPEIGVLFRQIKNLDQNEIDLIKSIVEKMTQQQNN